MKENILNIFADAAEGVLVAEMKVGIVTLGQPSLKNIKDTPHEITIYTEISGKLQGAVLYGMSEDVALKIVSAMSGEAVTVFDAMARSAITEFGNMITGNATMTLEAEGFLVKIAPPVLVVGKGENLPWKKPSDFQAVSVTLSTTVGDMEIFTFFNH